MVGAALAVPAFSLVAFWLYSLGMERAPVSSVTAPLIVLQTFVPALVGVALLGDEVRAGLVARRRRRPGAGDRAGPLLLSPRPAQKSRRRGDRVFSGSRSMTGSRISSIGLSVACVEHHARRP